MKFHYCETCVQQYVSDRDFDPPIFSQTGPNLRERVGS